MHFFGFAGGKERIYTPCTPNKLSAGFTQTDFWCLMYACMYVCMYVCMYAGFTETQMNTSKDVCACICVCIHMYETYRCASAKLIWTCSDRQGASRRIYIYIYIYIHTYIYIHIHTAAQVPSWSGHVVTDKGLAGENPVGSTDFSIAAASDKLTKLLAASHDPTRSCMYACMHVCVYVCMYACNSGVNGLLNRCCQWQVDENCWLRHISLRGPVCMHACVYVCM